MDKPRKSSRFFRMPKAGFLTKILAKSAERKLDDTETQETSASGDGSSITMQGKERLLSEKEISEINHEWNTLGKRGYKNAEEKKKVLLHIYRERARHDYREVTDIQTWGKFKREAVKVLEQVGFKGSEIGEDLERWRIIDLLDLSKDQKVELEIHGYRQRALEKGEKEAKQS